jgi:hypothetical protein
MVFGKGTFSDTLKSVEYGSWLPIKRDEIIITEGTKVLEVAE